MEEEKIKLLLSKLKELLSVLDDNYIDKIYNILIQDSDYDRLFYHYVKEYKINQSDAKILCCNYILSKTKSDKLKKEYIYNYFSNNIDESINSCECEGNYSNIYDDIDFGLLSFYENLNDLKEGLYDNESIGMLNINYGFEKNVENIHIKLYLLTIFFEYYNYYLDYIYNYELFNYNDEYYEVYNDIINSNDIMELINIFDENVDNILIMYNNYISLSKKQIDEIHVNSIKNNQVNTLFRIYPPVIFAFRKYYGYKFKDEKIDSIRLGEKTLEILNDLIKDSYGNEYNSVYEKALIIIGAKDDVENIDFWLMSLISNVYEHLLLEKEKEENCKYISIIENNEDYKLLINNKHFMCFILKKFYEYNSLVFDEKSLNDLNNSISLDKKKVLEKINPFYNQEKNYL